jgi:CheY-like chemotaxis protein
LTLPSLSHDTVPEETDAKQILCVDDDLDTLKVRKLLLGTAGYSVLTAGSGAEALRILAEGNNADLVLLDYMMPGMKGDELAARLREQYPQIRLIAVSAVGQLPLTFLELVDSNVQKGHDPEALLSTVSAVLKQPSRLAKNEGAVRPKTILCVEDERLQLQMRKMLLESAGFVVLEARSASEAMEIFQSRDVDAVVMDYWLSGKNGTAVAEEMKRLSPRVPIVMLSGFSSLPGESAIVDAWLRKAEVQPEDLINEVRRLIDRDTGTGQTPPPE